MEKLKNIASLALKKTTQAGAQTAYCTVSESRTKEFNVDGGEFSLFRTLFDRNLALTAFLDHRKGSVSGNKFDEESVSELAMECVKAAEGSQPDPAWEIAEGNGEKEFLSGVYEPDTEKLFFRTKELMEDISSRYPKILVEQLIVTHKSVDSVYMSTTGNTYCSKYGYYNVSLMFSAHDGEKSSSFYGTDVTLDDLETSFIDCAHFARELEEVEKQVDTRSAQGKFVGTVVFAPGCLASTLYSVCTNFASDGVILDGTSVWKDMLGKKVADERITVSLNPRDPRVVCGENYTTEGYLSEDYDIIKDGVLNRFMLSRYVANKTGHTAAPNSSFALVVKNGDVPIEEIIKGIDKGILVGRFSGGSPAGNGEFSGVAKNGFFIENGKITDAVSETMISGNLVTMLNNLVAVSRETLVDGGIVVPYMAFDGITVSGKE